MLDGISKRQVRQRRATGRDGGAAAGCRGSPEAGGAAEDAVALGLHPQNDITGQQGEAVSPTALFI